MLTYVLASLERVLWRGLGVAPHQPRGHAPRNILQVQIIDNTILCACVKYISYIVVACYQVSLLSLPL